MLGERVIHGLRGRKVTLRWEKMRRKLTLCRHERNTRGFTKCDGNPRVVSTCTSGSRYIYIQYGERHVMRKER